MPPLEHAIGKDQVGAREQDHARREQREPRGADRDRVRAERRELDAEVVHRVGRQAARAFLADRLEHQIRRRDAAADDDDFGIDGRGERRDGHADVLRGVADDGDGDAVAAARAFEHELRR